MDRLWVYNLTEENYWIEYTREEYFKWLEEKHCAAIRKKMKEDKELDERFKS
jgi:hypothetical protein